jgi:hypothetical protein
VRLENAGYSLESVGKGVLSLCSASDMSDHETGCSLVQNEFSGMDGLGQLLQHILNGDSIGNERVDDLSPGLVQALIPNAGREEFNGVLEAFGREPDVLSSLLEELGTPAGLHQIHLVNETKDLGLRRAFFQSADDVAEVENVGSKFS